MDILKLMVLIACLSKGESLYFFLNEGQQRCFYEDLPINVIVTGTYNLLIYDDSHKLFLPANQYGVRVTVLDPDDYVTLSKTYSAQGRFMFSSAMEGHHAICLSANSSEWKGATKMQIHLDIRVGSYDLLSIGHKETLTEMQLRMKVLLEQMDLILKEQEYQKHREIAFRQTSDNTSLVVMLSIIFLPIIIIFLKIAQSSHLKKFFIAKKLV